MLDADPLSLLAGELDHRPELPILLDLLADAEERAGAAARFSQALPEKTPWVAHA